MHNSMVLAQSPIAFGTERSIIALLRRDEVLDAAAYKASRLIASSKTTFKAELTEVRDAAKELQAGARVHGQRTF